MTTVLGFIAGYLLASFGLAILIGRWLGRSSAQDEADGDETANALRYLVKMHPEILRGR